MRTFSKYERCKICRELVADPDDCENCKNKCDPLSFGPRRTISDGRRGAPTLDIIEGNWEEWRGGSA